MLTKEQAVGFHPYAKYPTYEYVDAAGTGKTAMCDGSRMTPAPEGHTEVVHYQDEDGHFASYVESIIEEHANRSDEELTKDPPFIGRGRNARWIDARRIRQEK